MLRLFHPGRRRSRFCRDAEGVASGRMGKIARFRAMRGQKCGSGAEVIKDSVAQCLIWERMRALSCLKGCPFAIAGDAGEDLQS